MSTPHTHHDHTAHQHHGAVVHEPPADVATSYQRAFEAAQPDPGRQVVSVALEAGEIDWTFAPGSTTRAWGYNGQIPGPTIEARVGDVLEVRFTNRLAQPTNIHWHGLRVPAAMDGTEMVQRTEVHLPFSASRCRYVLVPPAQQRDRAARNGSVWRADRARCG